MRLTGSEYAPLKPRGYQPRLIDAKLHHLLTTHDVVRLVGPHGAGKSWCALAQGRSVTTVSDESVRPMLETSPERAISGGQPPHIVDEWELIPELARAVASSSRPPFLLVSSTDRHPSEEKYLSGSPVVRLWPYTLTESGLSNLSVSLMGLFSNDFYPIACGMDIPELAEAMCRGGWARVQDIGGSTAGRLVQVIMQTVIEQETSFLKKRLPLAIRVYVALAACGWQSTYEDFALYVRSRGEKPFSRNTARTYLKVLQETYLAYPVSGWAAPIRSTSRVRIKPRLSFVDPSLPAMLLAQTPETLLEDAPTFLSLLRCLVLRDVNAYASVLEGDAEPTVRYYADSDGGRADAVITLSDGRWGALNVAIGEAQAPDAMRALVRLRSKLRKNPGNGCPDPSFLAVLLASCNRPRLDRETGVYVFPVGCLTA